LKKRSEHVLEQKRGLVVVLTGDGKGKTTCSLGMALRAWGQGLRILMLQFIKGSGVSGERLSAKKMDGLEIRLLGKGFILSDDEKEMDEFLNKKK